MKTKIKDGHVHTDSLDVNCAKCYKAGADERVKQILKLIKNHKHGNCYHSSIVLCDKQIKDIEGML